MKILAPRYFEFCHPCRTVMQRPKLERSHEHLVGLHRVSIGHGGGRFQSQDCLELPGKYRGLEHHINTSIPCSGSKAQDRGDSRSPGL